MKRKLVVALLACTLFSSQLVWANEESDNLQTVIKEVKQKITIPDELTEFSYSLSDGVYDLSWSQKEGNESIDINCEEDGDIINYYYYSPESGSTALAEIGYEKAEKMAESFLSEAVPEYAAQLVPSPDKIPSNGDSYEINFNLFHKDIQLYDKQVTVDVNKESGKITCFYGLNYDDKADYSQSAPVLDQEAAEKLYLSKIGFPLTYETYFDDKGDSHAFLVYKIRDDEHAGIDAATGSKVTQISQDGYINGKGGMGAENAMTTSAGMMEMADAEEEELSDAEQKTVDTAEDLLSAKALKEKMTAYFPMLGKMTITSSGIYKNDESYNRNIHCSYTKNGQTVMEADFSCDAKTGELKWMDCYDEQNEKNSKGSKDTMTQEEAKAFINKVNPSKAGDLLLNKENTRDNSNEKSFEFVRLYKGIPVDGESIELTYDPDYGQVTSYYVSWEDGISFPSAAGVLDKAAVLKQAGIGLYYMETAPHKYTLVYTHKDNDVNFDAFTGRQVDYNGRELLIQGGTYYTDIAGHKDEELIKKLYDSGIYLEGTELKPDTVITQKELIRLIMQATSWYDDEKSAYEEAVRQGILQASEKSPDKLMTRKEAVIYLINATPYQKLAKLSDIFKYPYKDNAVDENLKGYVALAYGLQILEGNRDFKPDEKLTKAEAMEMIYHLLQNE